jgi:hypothetical protein
MRVTLGSSSFEVPDEWRHQAKYTFETPDGAGVLIAEVARETMDAAAAFAALHASYIGAWEPTIIYVNHIKMARPGGGEVPAAEGEQTSLDGADRLRFALAAATSPTWVAAITITLPSSRDFLALARRIVATTKLVDEVIPAAPRVADFMPVQAAALSLQVPSSWTQPDSLEFLDKDFDSVSVRVTLAEAPTPAGTIDWKKVFPGRVHVLGEHAEVAAPMEWESRWAIERKPDDARVIVRKAMVSLRPGTTVTAYGQAPESRVTLLDRGWSMLRSTLRMEPQG